MSTWIFKPRVLVYCFEFSLSCYGCQPRLKTERGHEAYLSSARCQPVISKQWGIIFILLLLFLNCYIMMLLIIYKLSTHKKSIWHCWQVFIPCILVGSHKSLPLEKSEQCLKKRGNKVNKKKKKDNAKLYQ